MIRSNHGISFPLLGCMLAGLGIVGHWGNWGMVKILKLYNVTRKSSTGSKMVFEGNKIPTIDASRAS